jgi:hypothetical protein
MKYTYLQTFIFLRLQLTSWSPPLEHDSDLAGQEIPHLLCDTEAQQRVHKSSPLDTILS